MTITPGKYRHYKNKDYEVLEVATHTETGEEFVVYRSLYGNYSTWIRPLAMFSETVNVDGKRVPRFEKID